MLRELDPSQFVPYTLCVETKEEHLLLIRAIDVAIDTYDIKDLPVSDFEYLRNIIMGYSK